MKTKLNFTKPKKDQIGISLRLPPDLHEVLDKISGNSNSSNSAVVSTIVENYLIEWKKENANLL